MGADDLCRVANEGMESEAQIVTKVRKRLHTIRMIVVPLQLSEIIFFKYFRFV